MKLVLRLALLGLALPFTACAVPGTITIPLENRRPRLDVAAADFFRIPPDERRKKIKKLVLETRTIIMNRTTQERIQQGGNTARAILLQDAEWNAWISEFEREFVRNDIHVMERSKLEDLYREGDIAAEEAAELLGADALFQINVLEVIEDQRTYDLRKERLYHATANGHIQVNDFLLREFYCRVDAKLIQADGTVLWSGEIHFPATALAEDGSIQLTYDLTDNPAEGHRLIRQTTPVAPNPRLSVQWKGEVLDLSPMDSILPGRFPTTEELLRVVTKFTARRFVRDIFDSKDSL